jgi:GNAT superfamily N-acetyltransferase
MIRAALPADVQEILVMVRELAEYERSPEQARATQAQLHEALFGENPSVFALIAEDDTSGDTVGFALWFRNFSTWTGTHGAYLEDLYVRPAARGAGHGKALLAAIAAICVERGYERFEWSVLDWNEPAIRVYRSIGATPQDEWTVQRLSGDPLRSLARLADRGAVAAEAGVNGTTSLSN